MQATKLSHISSNFLVAILTNIKSDINYILLNPIYPVIISFQCIINMESYYQDSLYFIPELHLEIQYVFYT